MGNRRLRRATEREMTESVVIGDLERNIYLHEHKDGYVAKEGVIGACLWKGETLANALIEEMQIQGVKAIRISVAMGKSKQ